MAKLRKASTKKRSRRPVEIFVAKRFESSVSTLKNVLAHALQISLTSDSRFPLAAGFPVLPKFYFVEPDCTAAERAHPGSQRRLANNFADKELHLWGQSVYIISQLLGECY